MQHQRSQFTAGRPPRPEDLQTAVDVLTYAREMVKALSPHVFGWPDSTLEQAQLQLERITPWITPPAAPAETPTHPRG